jgi:hypothetical protein
MITQIATTKPDNVLIISPSMITAYRNCQKLWYITYVLKERPAPSKAQIMGSEVHKVLEEYFAEDRILPSNRAGEVASAGLHLLPARGATVLGVEKDLFFQASGKPYWFRGIVDLLTDTHMFDHKTTSDFRWAKTPAELRTDPQAIIYAEIWRILTKQHAKTPGAQWTYFYTGKRPKAKAIVFNKIEPLKSLFEICDEIYKKWKDPENSVFEKSSAHCPKYRGCAHRNHCGVSFFDLLESKKMPTIVERLKEMKTDTPGTFEEFRAQNPQLRIIEAKREWEKRPLSAPRDLVNPPKIEPSTDPEIKPLTEKDQLPEINPKDRISAVVQEGLAKEFWRDAYKEYGGKRYTQKLEKELEQLAPSTHLTLDEVSDTFTLYMDCYPVKSILQPTLLTDFLAPFIEQVELEHNLEFWAATPYDKGSQLVADLVMQIDQFPAAIYLTEYATPKSVLLALVSKATTIIKKA